MNAGIVIPIGVCVVLPVLVIWIYYKYQSKMMETRSAVVMKALEKDASANVRELMEMLHAEKPSSENKGLYKLIWGWLTAVIGVGALFVSVVEYCHAMLFNDFVISFSLIGFPSLGVGIGLLTSYYEGRRIRREEASEETDE